MSSFFIDFPTTNYTFGNESNNVVFDNLTVYVDLIDQIKDNIQYYQTYTIKDEDRPDTLSQDFYDTTDYHWSFFLSNGSLRESGWPLSSNEIYSFIKERYPNRVVITDDNISKFNIGDRVIDTETRVYGEVILKNYELGQIVIKTQLDENGIQKQLYGGRRISSRVLVKQKPQRDSDGSVNWVDTDVFISYKSDLEQYNAPHHYENKNGEILNIEILYNIENRYFYFNYDQTQGAEVYEVTNMDYFVSKNEELKRIKVIKREVIESVVQEYKNLLQG
jgi:hypothetical protein